MAFLNPERVERQGGQNQLYERSTEKGFSKEKFEEETEGKISHGFLSIGGILAGPNLPTEGFDFLVKTSPQGSTGYAFLEKYLLTEQKGTIFGKNIF